MKSAENGRIVSVWAGMVVGLSVLLASQAAMSATVSLGGAGAYSYARDVSPEADGDILGEAYSANLVQYRQAGNSWFYRPETYNAAGELIFHFQADPRHEIRNASVDSHMRIFDSGATLYIEGFWSTDNSNWTSFARVEADENNYDLINLEGFTPSPDLYLKYDLYSSSPSVQSYVRLFLSDDRNSTDGFVVQGTITLIPEPSTLCLIGLGLASLVGRRVRRR